MARSMHATYTAADRYERRHNARSRQYSRTTQGRILRDEVGAIR